MCSARVPATHRTGPPPMRALTSIRRGPLLVYLASTWNTPMWKPSAWRHSQEAVQGRQCSRARQVGRQAVQGVGVRVVTVQCLWAQPHPAGQRHRSSQPLHQAIQQVRPAQEGGRPCCGAVSRPTLDAFLAADGTPVLSCVLAAIMICCPHPQTSRLMQCCHPP